MALNMDALGKKIGPLTREYSWKDIVLYALAVGAGSSELEFCYEKSLKVIPTFSLATTFDFFWHIAKESNINLSGILHGEQELIFHADIPLEGTLITEGTITNYHDKGKDRGALVVGKCDTFHSNGTRLFTSIYRLFARFDGGFGSDPAPKRIITYPESEPHYIVDALPPPDQNLLYRLTGDYFELHVDPEFAETSGFERPIMHGACTLGYGCRALIRKLTPGNPEKVKHLACRFSRFLYPGVPIQTLIWKIEEGRALWRVINTETGTALIDNGVCEYDV
jgi:acyl dehydratase